MSYRFCAREKEQFYNAIKQIPITEYAVSLGYTVLRKGHYFTLKEHDSIRIDPERNCFWRNSGIGDHVSGSIIDFALNVNGQSLSEVLPELERYLGENYIDHTSQKSEKKDDKNGNIINSIGLELPKPANNMHRVFAYLIKTRCIEPEIVQDFVHEKRLYQDQRGNCVFVSWKEGKPVFACKRGTNTEKKFIGDVSGCDYRRGFYIHYGADKTIVIESVIDAMSCMSIFHQQREDYKAYNYMILAGVDKEEALLNQLKSHPVSYLIIALDNDAAGKKAARRIQEKVKEGFGIKEIKEQYSRQKDWNEELKKSVIHHSNEVKQPETSKEHFRKKATQRYQGMEQEASRTLG